MSYQGDPSLTEDPGSSFATVWSAVVSELNGELATDSAALNGEPYVPPLTPQQRAWLNLVQPLTIVEGFAHRVDRNSRYHAREKDPGDTNRDRKCARESLPRCDIAIANREAGDGERPAT